MSRVSPTQLALLSITESAAGVLLTAYLAALESEAAL